MTDNRHVAQLCLDALEASAIEAWRDEAFARMTEQRVASKVFDADEAANTVLSLLVNAFPSDAPRPDCHVFTVRRGDASLGSCWLLVEGGSRSGAVVLMDLVCEGLSNEDLPLLRQAIIEEARHLGAQRLQVRCAVGDEQSARFAESAEFELVASRLIRRLDTTTSLVPEGLDVELHEMSDDEFALFRADLVVSYAESMARSGSVAAENALDASETQTAQLLPDAQRTKNHFLFRLRHRDVAVGHVWLYETPTPESRSGFVYDVVIDEAVRGRGLGRAAMLATEKFFRDRDAKNIQLNVFGFNEVARRLYSSIGYVVTEEFYSVDCP